MTVYNKRHSLFPVLIFMIGLLVLGGCATPPAADIDAPMTLPQEQAYLLRPGDTIKITVYGEEDVTGEYMVNPMGYVNVPLVGRIQASGLSEEELRTRLKNVFVSKGYLSSPIVTAGVFTSRPFFIMGEVKNPGTYTYLPNLDTFEAISMAGGYTPRAARNKILIDRGNGPQKVQMNATHNTPILPGDSITVRERIF